MSLTINLYKNFSKRDNSTLQPAAGVSYDTFSCAIKAGCSITSPVIDVNLTSGSDPAAAGYNYGYIPAYSRYYFITDWEYIEGIWVASLAVDVLASFKTSIGTLQPYVRRCSDVYDGDISDGFYPATNTWNAYQEDIPSFFDNANGSYVIGIFGMDQGLTSPTYDNNPQGCVTYWSATASELKQLMTYLMDSAFVNNYLTGGDVSAAMVKNFADPIQFIESVRYYPFNTSQTHQSSTVARRPKLGYFDTSSDQSVPKLVPLTRRYDEFQLDPQQANPSLIWTVSHNPNAATGSEFLNFPPYIQYELTYEPFGKIPLDASLIGGETTLYFGLVVDYVSGEGRLSIGTQLAKGNLGTYNAMVGVPVSLAQITEDILGASTSVLGSVASAFTGNISGVFQGINNAIQSAAPQQKTVGSNGAMLSYLGANKAFITTKYCDCVDQDPGHFGRPLCKQITGINALSAGTYIECADGENDVPCLSSERDMISAYLTGGMFYE